MLGGRRSATSSADRVAQEVEIRCAALNSIGLFSTHGELRPSWVPFAACLHAAQFDAIMLTEPHLHPSSSLPGDCGFQLVAAPCVEQRSCRRDAAIAARIDAHTWRQLPSPDADIVAASPCGILPPVLMISAYAPDSSRGPESRADFFDRLESALQRWRPDDPNAVIVLYIDANSWDPALDCTRSASSDLPRMHGILRAFGLHVVNQPSCSTHRSGTIIDWIATTHPSRVHDLRVHSVHCDGCCPLHPACYPAVGSDHHLITFRIQATQSPSEQVPSEPRLLRCDWHRAIPDVAELVTDLQHCLDDAVGEYRPGVQQLVLDALSCKTFEILWHAADMQGAVKCGARTGRRRGCRWWDAECERLWRSRQEAFQQFRLSPSPATRESYRRARNMFAHQVRRSQRAGWEWLIGAVEAARPWNQRQVSRVVRQEIRSTGHGPPPHMRREGVILDAGSTLQAWSDHFSQVRPEAPPSWASQLEAVVAEWLTDSCSGARPVVVEELRAAAHGAAANARTAPGIDGLPYEPFLVTDPSWETLLCSIFSLALRWGKVPRFWTMGAVSPIPKDGDPMEFDNWRPITLLSCMGKLFEHVLLRRISAPILTTIAPSQAGFRFGADEQAFALVESLRERLAGSPRRGRPLVAFVDVRKAYDVVWREGLLWKLRGRGVAGPEWHAVAALLGRSAAFAQLHGGRSPVWMCSDGVRQGSVLSPLLFLVFIDDLAHALLQIPGIMSFLYADDIAIIADTPEALQAGLDAISRWAANWRMSFGAGAAKSAVMQFPRGRGEGESPFTLAGRALPWVSEYRYLGVVIDRGLTFRPHVTDRGNRARAAFFACCGWAQRERLPIAVTVRLFEVHVVPKIMWGMELLAFSGPRMRELDAWQRRIGRWILRDFRAPDAVVLGDLGWRTWSSLALERAAALRSRLMRSDPHSVALDVARTSVQRPHGWMSLVDEALRSIGVRLPQSQVLPPVLRREIYPVIRHHDALAWRNRLSGYSDQGLQYYCASVNRRSLPAVHRLCRPRAAAAWCRLRHGGSTLPGHRGTRHRSRIFACALCGDPAPTTAHALFHCQGTIAARQQWWQAVQHLAPAGPAIVDWFFASNAAPHAARAHASFALAVERLFGS